MFTFKPFYALGFLCLYTIKTTKAKSQKGITTELKKKLVEKIKIATVTEGKTDARE